MSYFANWRNFPKEAKALGITRFPPKGIKFENAPNLAPSEGLLREYKNNEIDGYMFAVKYQDELEKRFAAPSILLEKLEKYAEGKDVILCCYEKKGDFCHRHLLAQWLGQGEEL